MACVGWISFVSRFGFRIGDLKRCAARRLYCWTNGIDDDS